MRNSRRVGALYGERTQSTGALMELHGKRVVVIDGTSGIGRAVAHESQALGASVVVASVVVRRAAPTRSKARAGGADAYVVDVKAEAAAAYIMEGRIWHTSGQNITTDEDRALLFGYYTKAFIRPQWNFTASLAPEVQASMTPLMRSVWTFGSTTRTRRSSGLVRVRDFATSADGGVRRAVCISAQRAPRRGSGEAMIMRIQTLVLAISDGRPANA